MDQKVIHVEGITSNLQDKSGQRKLHAPKQSRWAFYCQNSGPEVGHAFTLGCYK